jgi:condensin complex subunit 1
MGTSSHPYVYYSPNELYHRHAFAFQISLLQSLQYFEHLAEPMAEILDVLDKEFDVSGVGDEVLR